VKRALSEGDRQLSPAMEVERMAWIIKSIMARRIASVVLAVTLAFSVTACDSGDDGDVDQTEEQLEDKADETEDNLEDKADEVEEDLRDATP